MGAGVGRLYLHTVRPATATQSDQTQRRTPVPSQDADMHTDKPQTHTHTVRPQTASPETVAHVFTQSGNRGGRMQNQTNKTCRVRPHMQTGTKSDLGDTESSQIRDPRHTARQGAHTGDDQAGGGGARPACRRQTPRGDRAEVCGACRPAGQIPSPTDACRRRRAQTTDARQAQPAAD